MEKAVLILGGFSEITEEYVRCIRKRGLKAIIVDSRKNKLNQLYRYKQCNPHHFINLVDEIICMEEYSMESFFLVVNNILEHDQIVGIIPIDERLVVETAILAGYLGLSNGGLEAAVISRNKEKQRQLIQNTPWKVRSQKVTLEELMTTILPDSGVIKPINKYGSMDVMIWSDENQKKSVLDLLKVQKSKEQLYLLEERIVGQEYSIESWVRDGGVLYSSITKKQTLKSEGIEFPVEIGHQVHYRELSEDTIQQVNEMNHFVITMSKIQSAIVHLEFKIDESGIPKVMEWCVRNPGDRIMDLYLYAGEVNPYDLLLSIVLNEPGKEYVSSHSSKKVIQKYYVLEEDTILKGKMSHHDLPVHWPSNPDSQGLVRNREGVLIDKGLDLTVYELGILVPPNQKALPVKDSLTRHLYIVYSINSSSSQDMEMSEKILNETIINQLYE
ncbi:ATP-grasp domain-containing protein [Thermoactinomyces sp. DSM 45891]|uniref:ATP-grasp domain-containing protein n=1 Tax=Thermoactinomyces sp. DSM 45891 TaxID=1761907 RepID=UPI000931C726|nr:ATP-grasp domain-containing protein [Thermoactinomyces sp. DSM 45891]